MVKFNLTELREKKKYTKRQLAIKSGVTRSYISEIESGKYKNPGIKILCKLSKALNCELEDLVVCENEKKK